MLLSLPVCYVLLFVAAASAARSVEQHDLSPSTKQSFQSFQPINLPPHIIAHSSASLVRTGSNEISMFFLNQNFTILHARMTNKGHVTSVSTIGSGFSVAPTAVVPFEGAIDLYVVDGYGNPLLRRFRHGSWSSSHEYLGGKIEVRTRFPIGAIAVSSTKVHIFVTSIDNQLYTRTLSFDVWNEWAYIGHEVIDAPAPAIGADGTAYVYTQNGRRQVWRKPVSAAGNNGWHRVPNVRSDLSALAMCNFKNGNIAMFGTGGWLDILHGYDISPTTVRPFAITYAWLWSTYPPRCILLEGSNVGIVINRRSQYYLVTV